MKLHTLILSAAMVAGTAAAADFSYVDKGEMTGGSLKKMIGFVSRFGGQKPGPITTTHKFHGDKMVSENDKSAEIYDLGAETITHLDREKKEYATITFAQMGEAMKEMARKLGEMRGQKNETGVQAKWKGSFDANGQTRQVAGVAAKGGTMKLEMEATDTKSGQQGAMKMDMDVWMGSVPGYEVAREFYKKMATKLAYRSGPEMMALAQAGPGALEGFAEAGRKMQDLGEMSLMTVMKMHGGPGGAAGMPDMPDIKGPSKSDVGEQVGREAGSQAGYEAGRKLGRFGGLAGGLGGRLGGKLGKGKEQPPEPAAAKEAPAATPAPASDAGVLMEFTTEVISYSSAAVDAASFQVPAGYKQVEHPMKKAWAKDK